MTNEHREQARERIAQLIADDLFTNGLQQKAEHLVLISADGKDLGGLSWRAVYSRG